MKDAPPLESMWRYGGLRLCVPGTLVGVLVALAGATAYPQQLIEPQGPGKAPRPVANLVRAPIDSLRREPLRHPGPLLEQAPSGPVGYCDHGPYGLAPTTQIFAYGFNTLFAHGWNGAGITIGIYEDAILSPADFHHFEVACGLHNSLRIETIGTPPPRGGDVLEATADAEIVAEFAPDASIVVYPSANWLDAWEAMVHSNLADILLTSWGYCEATAVRYGISSADYALFRLANEEGQTVVAAAGDQASTACRTEDIAYPSVQEPAADPLTLAVGGTTLLSTHPLREAAWSDGFEGGGGGLSMVWPRPSWQAGPGVIEPGLSNGHREVPDVSASANPEVDPYWIYCNEPACQTSSSFGWALVGGTSTSAPLWAGLLADAEEAVGHRLGLINPLLYQLAAGREPPFDFVIQGSNSTPTDPGHYPAGPGYNMAAGLGGPLAYRLVEEMLQLPKDHAPNMASRS
jgi:kumamolisin